MHDMSDKWMLYGVIGSSGGNMTGLDGQVLPVWWVDVGLANQRWVGFSVTGAALAVGDVVSIVQCYETNDTWGQVWGLIPYADGQHSVVSVSNYATMRQLEWEYPATCALNWLCNYAGAKQSLYWPGTVTAVGSSSLTVKNRWETFTREVPIDAGLSAGDFGVGDTVLIYSPSPSAEVCVGWWMMQPGAGAIITGTLSFTDMDNIYPGDGGVLVLRLENISNKTAQDITVTFSNSPGAFVAPIGGTTWHVGSMAPGEVQTHYINVVFKGIWPTTTGYEVNIAVTDTSLKTTYVGATTLSFMIRQASFVFNWDCFTPCRVYAPSGVSTGYVSTLHRDTGGGVWKTFAVAYLQYAYPEPIGIFFELELDAYYGFEYGTAHVLSQGDGKNFKVIFEVSENFISPHKYPTFDINVTSNILVINNFELLDEPPSAY